MVITILAEPRSGSTNLANWFHYNKNFTTLFEPITNSNGISYKNGVSPKLWKYDKQHLIIKEIYHPGVDFTQLLEISDKVIVLYRNDINEQIESWVTANKTKNWDKTWFFKKDSINKEDASFLKQIKDGIKQEYLDKNYFNISYEELYYNNGFQKIVEYLNLDCVKNENFPYGQKYRINVDKPKTLI